MKSESVGSIRPTTYAYPPACDVAKQIRAVCLVQGRTDLCQQFRLLLNITCFEVVNLAHHSSVVSRPAIGHTFVSCQLNTIEWVHVISNDACGWRMPTSFAVKTCSPDLQWLRGCTHHIARQYVALKKCVPSLRSCYGTYT